MSSLSDNEPHIGILGLFALIFLEGYVSISVEVLTIRQLIPVMGNSVIVTSIIIGLFLLFLALGYYRGGAHQTQYLARLQRNFAICAVLLGIGLSYVVIRLVFMGITTYISSNDLVALVLYLLVVTAPLIFILGQTVPITTNLFRHEHHVGSISGRVLFLSTLGSFLGAVVTAAVFMNWVGVAWTVMLNFLALLALVVILLVITRKQVVTVLMTCLAGIVVYWLNVHVENNVFLRTTAYNNYRLINAYPNQETGPGRVLAINGSASSYLNDKNQGFHYIELIKRVLFSDLGMQGKDILVIGAGGFSLSAQGDFGNHIVYVDIDAAIKPVSKQGFIDKIHGEFIAQDARKFLMDKVSQYDVVLSDAYSNRHAIPSYLITQEHLHNIKRSLKPKGLAIFNIIASPLAATQYAKRVDNTIRSVFPSCTSTPIDFKGSISNIVYICTQSSYDEDKTVYRDNLNAVTLDFYRQ